MFKKDADLTRSVINQVASKQHERRSQARARGINPMNGDIGPKSSLNANSSVSSVPQSDPVNTEFPSSPRTSLFPRLTTSLQRIFPSVPTQIKVSSWPTTAVRKILFPQTAAVAPPEPGSLSFQATFLSAAHVVGNRVSLLIPSFFGPRQFGQFSA